jgi:ElaB/YqjD/DUF883 family membrane-anchored ribosome-binding protein
MASRVDERPARVGRKAETALAIVVFLAAAVAALGLVQRLPTAYAAASVVSFLPRPDGPLGADTVQLVGEKYAVLATSPDVLESVGRVTGQRPDDLRTATTAALAQGTGNLQVTVTTANATQAARAANEIADDLVRTSTRDQLVVGELTSRAVAEDAEVRPPRMLLRAAGVLAAALLAALTWAAVAGRKRRRRSARTSARTPARTSARTEESW